MSKNISTLKFQWFLLDGEKALNIDIEKSTVHAGMDNHLHHGFQLFVKGMHINNLVVYFTVGG